MQPSPGQVSPTESFASFRKSEPLFDLLIFDWDGTAVVDRQSPISDLLAALERVLTESITCMVVTGTNVDHLLDQGLARLSSEAKHSLYLSTNRGSEVWGFDSDGAIKILYKREATADENRALDRAAMSLQHDIGARGLSSQVIFDRLNRRKVDLIPEPRWVDPKKSEFRELHEAVVNRLHSAGIAGGLGTLIEDADRLSRSAGLKSPRITSDIKHIEIGLTDKSDSAQWAFSNLIRKRPIPTQRVAVLGDELGSIGGIQGSDSFLHIPELEDAMFISVGVEPDGVPYFVHHWGGGPSRFVRFLLDQADAREKSQASEQEIAWQIVQEGFEPSREREMETLFAIGNGCLGVRGASDFPIPAAQPDLLIAGIYGKKATAVPYSEVDMFTDGSRKSEDSEIVPFPSPFQFRLRMGGIDGKQFSSESGEVKTHLRKLDLGEGLYQEEHLFEDPKGRRTKVRTFRFVSLVDPHLLVQQIRIESKNYSGPLELDLSNRFLEQVPLYPHLDLISQDTHSGLSEVLLYRTKSSKIDCAVVSRLLSPKKKFDSASIHLDLAPGTSFEIYRVVSIFTDRDSSSPLTMACDHALSFDFAKVQQQHQAHLLSWHRFWSDADIRFESSPEFTQAQRFNLYHLRIAADRDPKISVPAKALTGRAYEGHIFWDSEIFMFPFFLYTEPEIAKNFLLYRYNTLAGAKTRAKEAGLKGAFYAWESTVAGDDVTPKSLVISGQKEEIPIFTGPQEIHITADIAYAVWQYWDATLDLQFLREHGAEILIETARFWASRVNKVDSVYHICGVVGPDEYHHGVSDNAYTNWMAKFNLEKSVWACRYLNEKDNSSYRALAFRLNLKDEEIESWRRISAQLFIPKPNQDGVIEQFAGFHKLKSVTLGENERYHAPVSRLLNWKEVNELRLVKQADLLMIPFLFPDAFSREILTANYNYYDPLTDHGSSLSPCVHAAIAARIGRLDDAKNYWERSLNLDLDNKMSNTALGIHAAAMGGTWQALVFHILGITLSDEGPHIAHATTETALSFLGDTQLKLIYRGKRYPVHLHHLKRRAA
jgi:alpha,alpha-trehalose phosphorylase